MSSKKNRSKQRRMRAGNRGASSSPSSAAKQADRKSSNSTGIHFTIGTGAHEDAVSGHLSLEHDARLVKTGLLYADSIRLCSIGSSLTARMLRITEADLDEQLDFLERYFTETIAKEDLEAAGTVVEFLRRYRELRQTRNSTPEQLKLRGQLLAEIQPIWQEFKQGWEAFATKAGVEQILAAQHTGLVELHEFSAGGIEHTGALDPSVADRRSDELFEDLTWELFDLLSSSVEDGTSMPLLDVEAGELVRLGIEAGEVETGDSGSYRARHAGLASGLLRRLPLFDAASVEEVVSIRAELDSPLTRFRGAIARLARTVRSEEWSTEFEAAIEEVMVREVEPAVQEIEERLQNNRYLSELSNGYRVAAATAPTVAVATYQLGSLPVLASVALGGASGLAAGAGTVYEQWKRERDDITSREMFFYREARRSLGSIGG